MSRNMEDLFSKDDLTPFEEQYLRDRGQLQRWEEGTEAAVVDKDDPLVEGGPNEGAVSPPEEKPISEMNVEELKAALRERELSTEGNKADLQARLAEATA